MVASIPRPSRFSAALACALLAHAAALLGIRLNSAHPAAASRPAVLYVSLASPALPTLAQAEHPASSARPATPRTPSPARATARAPTPPAPPAMAPQSPVGGAPSAPAEEEAAPLIPPRFEAAYLANPAPEYPRLSRELGEEGKTLLRVKVSAQGQPLEIQTARSSGFERLDQAAIATVWRWKFIPARRGNEPQEAWVQIPIRFGLRKPSSASL